MLTIKAMSSDCNLKYRKNIQESIKSRFEYWESRSDVFEFKLKIIPFEYRLSVHALGWWNRIFRGSGYGGRSVAALVDCSHDLKQST